MRRLAPVLHDRIHDLWLVFDLASVRAALNDPQTFSSRAAPPGGKPVNWLIFQDPPLHSRLRGLIMRSFTPQAVNALAPSVEARVETLLAPLRGRGAMDLVADFADLLPLQVIADLIGLPPNDEPRLHRWADAILHLGDTIAGGETAARAIANYAAMKEEAAPFVLGLVQQRRVTAGNDLLTRLAQSELADEEILDFFYLLLLAGSETTSNLIANAVLCLLQHPRELARLREQPALLGNTIEEVLRYRSPVQLVFRQTTRDVTLRGKRIPQGKLVLLMIGSANRELGNRFDITRAPSHIAFGHGAHFCIGATLARLEASIALPRLLELKNLRLKSWSPRNAINVHGPAHLNVTFDRERA